MPINVTVVSTSGSVGVGSLQVTPFTAVGTISPQVLGPNIGSGFNSITVPAGAVGFIFSPPPTNTNTLTLKGITGDTGVSLPIATPSVYFFGTAPATIGITAGGTVGVSEVLFF